MKSTFPRSFIARLKLSLDWSPSNADLREKVRQGITEDNSLIAGLAPKAHAVKNPTRSEQHGKRDRASRNFFRYIERKGLD